MALLATERRFRRLFRVLALSPAAAVGAVQACSTSSPEGAGDAAADATADTYQPGFGIVDATPEAFTWCDAGPPVDLTENASCRYFTHVPCGVPSSVSVGVYGDLSTCAIFCPDPGSFTKRCYLYDGSVRVDPLPDGGFNEGGADAIGPPVPEGGVAVECETCLGGGRRPAGWVDRPSSRCAAREARAARRRQRTGRRRGKGPPTAERAALGRYFASLARLEGASVVAFETMAAELAQHGAPASLVRAAERAACDERRHAAGMARMARRFDARARVDPGPVLPSPARSLLDMALENAVEGCVRETFGALVATFQAAQTREESVASLFGVIARDETRHAALSWEVARWAAGQLDAPANLRVATARARALADLRAEIAGQRPHRARVTLGLPTPAGGVALIDAMARSLDLQAA